MNTYDPKYVVPSYYKCIIICSYFVKLWNTSKLNTYIMC